MLGELIWEGTGKRIVRRVVKADPPTVEVTFEGTGKLFGAAAVELGTYTSVIRPDGTMFGNGNGVVMTEDGTSASWTGSGVGVFGEKGAVSYRGAIYYTSAAPKLARLNRVAVVFEFGSSGEGATQSKAWEWK